MLVANGGDWRTTFRPDIPSAARIYDYLLGGKDHFAADRAVAEEMIAQLPNARLAVRWNRAFLRRVVRHLVAVVGIRQLIDIGAGQAHVRSRSEVRKLVTGLEILEPGLVWPPQWRPDPKDGTPASAAESYYCVLVARKP